MPAERNAVSSQLKELARLRVEAEVWEPAGRELLDELDAPPRARAVDVGCGAMGWLPLLDEWVGPDGHALGTDVDDALLAAAGTLIEERALDRVDLVNDDLLASRLPSGTFDLVHARFQLSSLDRARAQLEALVRLARPGGWIVLEDRDSSSWSFAPAAPAAECLVAMVVESFRQVGRDFDAGARGAGLLAAAGIEPHVRRTVITLEPGHPYLTLPLQLATALRPRLEQLVDVGELDAMFERAEAELDSPRRVGRTFALVQSYGRAPH